MKIIGKLANMISEEMDDSEKYAKCALRWKDEDPRLSDAFLNLSKQEMDHAKSLHENAARLIDAYSGEHPSGMSAVWEWEHDKMIEMETKVRELWRMIKE